MFSRDSHAESRSVAADSIDRRLLHLARLLAHQAAREALAETVTDQPTDVRHSIHPEIGDA